ncbi:hypothetical protein ACOAPY_01840 [Pseudomonas sp. P3C3]
MSNRELPFGIIDFFKRTTRKIDNLYKPAWLLSELSSPIWIIDAGTVVRTVDGAIKGGVRLNWNRLLPGGSFTSPIYAVPLEQARMMVVYAHDGALTLSKSLRGIGHFHLYILWLAEFLAVRYGDSFIDEGFSIFGMDDIVEFLGAAEEGGVCGTGAFIQRWENFLTVSQEGSGAESLTEHLENIGALDKSGAIKLRFAADALGIDYFRLSQSAEFKNHISRVFTDELEFRAENCSAERKVTALSNWMVTFCEVLASLPIRSNFELADSGLVLDVVRPFRSGDNGRTKTLPLSTGRSLMFGCAKWMIDTYPVLLNYYSEIIPLSCSIKKSSNFSAFSALYMSEEIVPLPVGLISSFNVYKRMQADPLLSEARVRTKFPFSIFMLRIHTAVCFCLIGVLSSCRRSELVELESRASYSVHGKYFLSVLLRKTGFDSIRASMQKPVPRLVDECLASLNALKEMLIKISPSNDILFNSQAFFKVNVRGSFPFDVTDAYVVLKELSEYLGLTDNFGMRWVVLPHQLRRYFAMTFFHFGGLENSLPALSWFMGHEDIGETWRYIKEGLTGKEISASEAALATSAVCSDDQSDGVKKLRSILVKHFGTDKINVMHEDELRDYLEMLSERGVYNATPIQISAGRKKIYTVAISIKESVCA